MTVNVPTKFSKMAVLCSCWEFVCSVKEVCRKIIYCCLVLITSSFLIQQRNTEGNHFVIVCSSKKEADPARAGWDFVCTTVFLHIHECMQPPLPIPTPSHLSSCMPVPRAQKLCFFNFILYFTRCPSYSDIPAGCQLVTDPQDSCCQVPDCPGQPNTSNNTIIIKGPIGTISGSSLPPNHRGPLTRNSQCMLNKLLFCIFLSIWQAWHIRNPCLTPWHKQQMVAAGQVRQLHCLQTRLIRESASLPHSFHMPIILYFSQHLTSMAHQKPLLDPPGTNNKW